MNAFARLTIGYWFPGQLYPEKWTNQPLIQYQKDNSFDDGWWHDIKPIPIKFTNHIVKFFSDITEKGNYELQRIPVFSVLLNMASYIWLFLIILLWSIINRRNELLYPFSIIIIYLITLFVGPISLYRYAFPIVSICPVLLGYVFSCENNLKLKRSMGEG